MRGDPNRDLSDKMGHGGNGDNVRSAMEMSEEEIDIFLQNHKTGVLSLSKDDNSTYSIPMSYGYDPEGKFLCLMFGYAPDSEKKKWIERTKLASFVVHDLHDSLEAESVVISGILTKLTEEEEEKGYRALSNNAGLTVLHESGALLEDTTFEMYRLEIDYIMGKKFEHDIS